MAVGAPVVIGSVGRPHGVRGEVRVTPTGPTLASIRPGESLILTADGHERVLEVDGARPVPGAVIVQLRGVSTREAAAELTGAVVAVAPSRLAPLGDPDEFYVRDLIGCGVIAGDRSLGSVVDVHPGAVNDALVVRPSDGADLLVPFTRDAIVALDLRARLLRVRPDLLEGGAG